MKWKIWDERKIISRRETVEFIYMRFIWIMNMTSKARNINGNCDKRTRFTHEIGVLKTSSKHTDIIVYICMDINIIN